MNDQPVNTVQLNGWIDRMRAGDTKARDELIRAVGARLEKLARKMLTSFPTVSRWAEVDDVLQNASLRLLRALGEIRPSSTRDFFGLAAEQIRRELLDLARHFHGPLGVAANQQSWSGSDSQAPAVNASTPSEVPEELDRWESFHGAVESLPTEEREVVGLVFYHGWPQQDVADLFQVSVRTVQRRWESALVKLRAAR